MEDFFKTVEHEKVMFTESQEREQVDIVDEGWHRAKLIESDIIHDVPIPERYQTEKRKTQDKIVLWFETIPEGQRVRRTVNYTWGPRSNAKKLFAGMLGKSIDERFNLSLEEVIGKECEILITHNPVEDYVYVNVEKARPIKDKKAKGD